MFVVLMDPTRSGSCQRDSTALPIVFDVSLAFYAGTYSLHAHFALTSAHRVVLATKQDMQDI